ncbi:hypothetical protein [Gemmatimonas sp.]|uniref:hypothetical protein n=1 Tax=Gemmatimonas sp. TaxID=1962908 RepID=UPI00286C26AC|nr:hypothetical protein [Gemmatimonas sp.]
MQSPLFKELDKLFGDLPRRGGPGGGAPPRGGMGGGMPGGMGGPERGGARPGDERPDGNAAGGGLPDTVHVVIGRLSDIQDSHRDPAREQLTPVQRTRADSIQQVILAEERAKFEKEREQRRERR